MPSVALEKWNTERSRTFEDLEAAHRAVTGARRGRRFATLQVNHAYTVLLAAQFQAFCRDLHTESVDAIVLTVPQGVFNSVKLALLNERRLDRGNVSPGNLGADFGRFDFVFWNAVYASDPRNTARRESLERLNTWRNAIAHQDFANLGSETIQLAQVRQWRVTLNGLAEQFDAVMFARLSVMTGANPW